jgi:hypothetical protein
MSPTQDNSPPILSLLSAICDNAADQEDLNRLEEAVGQDADSIGLILDYFQLHFDLRFELASRIVSTPVLQEIGRIPVGHSAGGVASTIESSLLAPPLPILLHHSQSFGSAIFCYLIVAVMMGVGVLWAWTWNPVQNDGRRFLARQDALWEPSEIVGTITKMSDCRWVDPAAAATDGAYVHVGRKFALAAGQLEITFSSAYARLVLQGPAEFTVKGEDGGFLARGTATVHTTDRAGVRVGMRKIVGGWSLSVLTPTHFLTDRGGDFAVMVDRGGVTHIRLDRGFVQVWFPEGMTPNGRSFWPYRSTWASVYFTEKNELQSAVFGTGEAPLIVRMVDAGKDRSRRTAGGPVRLERKLSGQHAAEEMHDKGLP